MFDKEVVYSYEFFHEINDYDKTITVTGTKESFLNLSGKLAPKKEIDRMKIMMKNLNLKTIQYPTLNFKTYDVTCLADLIESFCQNVLQRGWNYFFVFFTFIWLHLGFCNKKYKKRIRKDSRAKVFQNSWWCF